MLVNNIDNVSYFSLACDYAIANGIGGFSPKSRDRCAGYYWLEGFMKRHSELSGEKAENLSVARAMVMNRPQVMVWRAYLQHHGGDGAREGETSTALVTIIACGHTSPPIVIHWGGIIRKQGSWPETRYHDSSKQKRVDQQDLTIFKKIATQGAPQMAVDKEANSLSRVYSYYSKFNLRLFYV